MERKLGFLVLLIVFWGVCSCTQKEEPAPNPSSVSVAAITLNPTSLTLTEGETSTITATISPSNASNQKVVWSSSDASVATINNGTVSGVSKGSAIITAMADDNGKTATCSITVNAKSGGGGGNGGGSITAVDLGLSVKWASYNLGANSVEGYGDHYAWGETETKDSYSWSTYKWCNGSEKTLTKYNIDKNYGAVDNKTVLSTEDDVAHVKLGGEWRIPTRAEWMELVEECDWTWTTHNLVCGYLVTAGNGNSIFLPASGQSADDQSSNVGSSLYYYSSSIASSEPSSVWMLYAYDSRRYKMDVSSPRYRGLSIRPVYGAPAVSEEISISAQVLTSSDCTVTFDTNSAKSYYAGVIGKSSWDKYGAAYVCDAYIKEDKDNGVLSQSLYSGHQSFDLHDLSTKTEYVAFATFCDKNGQRSGDIFSKSFTMK